MITVCQSPNECPNPPIPRFGEFCSSQCVEAYQEKFERAHAVVKGSIDALESKVAAGTTCLSLTCWNPVMQRDTFCSKECQRAARKLKHRFATLRAAKEEHETEIQQAERNGAPTSTVIELDISSKKKRIATMSSWIPSDRQAAYNGRAEKAFDEIMEAYEDKKHWEPRLTMSFNPDTGSGALDRPNKPPTVSDFLCDVEIAAKAALGPETKLFKIFEIVYVEQRCAQERIPADDLREIRRRVGRMLVSRRVWPLHVYFKPRSA